MSNVIWRLSADYLAAYTEDPEVIAKVRRSYPDFNEMATYERKGQVTGMQYRVPTARKRVAKRLFNVAEIT
ncbi:hypothetical protein JNUCC31_09035 [Paenibacillus sp. JNUCC31]|uniref:hypothetical protein n=1 Tax=Paenibacillus sp. JNUCC-31 TaxID=2777983 RepID=UPI001783BBB5|nr:hypothetical protein [Paenibacillus sp. JNUCC-31]QOS80993.1 hypothetical protein JNUCC31_09035 [Paenibacillus sp. JNUCC-31]